MPIPFSNSYAALPERFWARLQPQDAPAPDLIRLNRQLAKTLGLDSDWLASAEGVGMLAGGTAPKGADPLAMAYGGHQFGNWVPELGDGRACLLGEVVTPMGARFDLHLKGSGRTAFSRGGDGKAHLGAVLREYIVSEAMAALGIPTTRALAAVTTGETIMRETPLPGAVLARVAASHIRVGTFQYFLGRHDKEALQILVDYVVKRHYPKVAKAACIPLALLDAVMKRQARLVAQWMQVGFIHGVMNTDNMSISGETIDYGPCAFMDGFHPDTVFSSIDHAGRYAWGNQPVVAHWNLACFAQTLLELTAGDQTQTAATVQTTLAKFTGYFQQEYDTLFAAKIGLPTENTAARGLVARLLDLMAAERIDFTRAFRALSDSVTCRDAQPLLKMSSDTKGLSAWLSDWQAELAPLAPQETITRMTRANPVVIARNHRVEEAITAAISGNYAPFIKLTRLLQTPYRLSPKNAEYAHAPTQGQEVTQTFCGT